MVTSAGEWVDGKDMTQERTWCTAVIDKDLKTYVIGGYNIRGGFLDVVEVFDMTTHTWNLLPQRMNSRREGATSVYVPSTHSIYVFGGFDGLHQLNSAECYDISAKKWKDVKPMSTPREAAGAVLLEDKEQILVIGGYDGEYPLSSCELYDIRSGKWKPFKADMLSARGGCGCLIRQDKVYVFGGRNNFRRLKSCEVYDIATGVWTEIAPMGTNRWSFVVADIGGGKIQIMGGNDGCGDLKCIEIYDVYKDSWTTSATCLNRNRSAMALVCMKGGRMMIVGGKDGFNRYYSTEVFPDALLPAQATLADDSAQDAFVYATTVLPCATANILNLSGGTGANGTVPVASVAAAESVEATLRGNSNDNNVLLPIRCHARLEKIEVRIRMTKNPSSNLQKRIEALEKIIFKDHHRFKPSGTLLDRIDYLEDNVRSYLNSLPHK